MIKGIGELDRQIDIYTRTTGTNAFGEAPEAFTYNRTIWANVFSSAGNEKLESKRETASNQVIFTIRYTTITEVDRLKWGTDYYDILRIDLPDRKRYMEILAEKREV